jgi:transcription termination factor NusB
MSEQIKKSRRKTRQCLFQALYSCMYLKQSFDRELFLASFYEEEFSTVLDLTYFDEVFA